MWTVWGAKREWFYITYYSTLIYKVKNIITLKHFFVNPVFINFHQIFAYPLKMYQDPNLQNQLNSFHSQLPLYSEQLLIYRLAKLYNQLYRNLIEFLLPIFRSIYFHVFNQVSCQNFCSRKILNFQCMVALQRIFRREFYFYKYFALPFYFLNNLLF